MKSSSKSKGRDDMGQERGVGGGEVVRIFSAALKNNQMKKNHKLKKIFILCSYSIAYAYI